MRGRSSRPTVDREMKPGPFSQLTARLGPGLKFVLAAIGIIGLLEALLTHWMGMAETWQFLVCTPEGVMSGQLWRLLTAGFLTDISHPMGLLFTLVGENWTTQRLYP